MFKQSRTGPGLPAYVFLIILSLIILGPLLIILSQSLMGNQEINRWPPKLLTLTPNFGNYVSMFNRQDLLLGRWLANSLFAATAHTLAVFFVCAPAAYAFARLRFPGNNILFFLLLVTVMVPGQVTLIPNF